MNAQYTRTGQAWSLLFAFGYLVFLVPLVYSDMAAPRLAGSRAALAAGIAAFVALDILYWLRHGRWTGRWVENAVTLAGMCAVGVWLSFQDPNWLWSFIYCAVAAGSLCVRLPVAAALLAATIGLTLVLAAALHQVGETLVPLVLVMLMGGLAMIGLGRIFESNHELRLAREEVARLAVAEERLRFARDLHDLLGHSLSVIVLKSELAGRLAETAPDRSAEEVRDIERVARGALREVRDAVAGYRQPGLSHELESARATLAAAGMVTAIDASAGPLPTPLDSTLAWALREGVTNVVRHSQATHVELRVARRGDHVELELLDDGVGCDGCAGGNGLRGLGERVGARDGTVSFGPRPDGGFGLSVSLPLKERPRSPVPAAR